MKKLTTNLIIILSNLLIVYFNQNLWKKLKKKYIERDQAFGPKKLGPHDYPKKKKLICMELHGQAYTFGFLLFLCWGANDMLSTSQDSSNQIKIKSQVGIFWTKKTLINTQKISISQFITLKYP